MSAPAENKIAGPLSDELQALGNVGEERIYQAGETIFSVGDPGDGFHIVESGRVEISGALSGSEARVLATISPGDFFGEMAVLDDLPRSATARAEIPTRTRFLNRAELLQWLDHQPRMALNLMREFGKRMRALNHKYLDEILQAERLAVVGRFAGTIVHDFKNPLNIIGLSAELACEPDSSVTTRQESKRYIHQQVSRMTHMLNELIEFTRPSGRRPALTAMNFAHFLNRLADEIRPEVKARRVELEVHGAPPNLSVLMEPQRLSRLFYNLINNAVDEMHAGGKIMIRFDVKDDELHVEVEDTGKGIASEIAQQLFQPFATHGKSHGTGLGLSICKKIAEDHGGRIWARSEPGRGATFCFTLPLPKPEST
jgi:signal transduction histidine kinase